MPTSNEIPIEELNNILEANQEISPGMKNALDNLKEEYNQAYKSLMIYPDQEIPDEFVEELLGARKKLMDYNYLSDEERQYHQDILEGVKKMNKRLQEDPTFTIERSDAAKGGLIKRVKLRGGKDASQSDFGAGPGEVGSDAGFDNDSPSRVTEINIGDAPTVFDINKVGDPSQNPKSINVRGGIDYTPSFATPPSFLDKAISKGKSFVKFASPFLVNAAFGTFVPTKVKQGIALFNLAKNFDKIGDIVAQETLKEDMAIAPDDREEFKGGGIKKIPIRSNKYGVKELDYRKSGGFVPIGVKEKADDVPAMLSKNEFVFTADAVRGAGNGSINKGAQRMYNLMKNLEARKA